MFYIQLSGCVRRAWFRCHRAHRLVAVRARTAYQKVDIREMCIRRGCVVPSDVARQNRAYQRSHTPGESTMRRGRVTIAPKSLHPSTIDGACPSLSSRMPRGP